ncbi:MAG TPA: MarR family transcriptional regulator [Thermoflexales bacterium]|jgi:DNA-binding MarR family transcriptional regulator|nr:MarR family transcriptional regulator [Anaerolineae bacterium]HQV27983.1 MarR family transcriptional regulator [Thermoflexales bacterium]HQX10294.1 MarR family transcriptional regulator [Thermoflexales bacterium]HQY25620.1 MarR family transcriptional regulator [Thermoflexales bacterium]HQZ54799.1 MarR family transcriptional regulator [Thermoflexales bacterium]
MNTAAGSDPNAHGLMPPDVTTAHAIHMLLAGITKLTWRQIEERMQEVHPGLTGMHLGVLRILSRRDFTLSELGLRMTVTPSTLVPVVDRLQELGLVSRQKDPNDRRRTPLAVTPDALALLASLPLHETHARLVDGLRQLGPTRAQALHSLLLELLGAMDPEGALMKECAVAAEPRESRSQP